MMPSVDAKVTARDVKFDCCDGCNISCFGSKTQQEASEHPHHHASISEVPVQHTSAVREGEREQVIYVLDRSGHQLQAKSVPKNKQLSRNRKAVAQYYNDMANGYGSDLTAIIVAISRVSFIQMYREGKPLDGSSVHFVDSCAKTITSIQGAVEHVLGHVNSFLVDDIDNESFVIQAYLALSQHPFSRDMEGERVRRKSAGHEQVGRTQGMAGVFQEGQQRFLNVAQKIVSLGLTDFQTIALTLKELRNDINKSVPKTLKEIVEKGSIISELERDVGQKLYVLANTIYVEWKKIHDREQKIRPDADVTFFHALDSLNEKKTPRPALTPAIGVGSAALPPISDSASSDSRQDGGDTRVDMEDEFHEDSPFQRTRKPLRDLRQAVQVRRAMQGEPSHSAHRKAAGHEYGGDDEAENTRMVSRRVGFVPDEREEKKDPPRRKTSIPNRSFARHEQTRVQKEPEEEDEGDNAIEENEDEETADQHELNSGGVRSWLKAGVSMAGHMLVDTAVSLISRGHNDPQGGKESQNDSPKVGRSESVSPEVERRVSELLEGDEDEEEYQGERVIGRREHHIHSGDSSHGAHKVVIKRTKIQGGKESQNDSPEVERQVSELLEGDEDEEEYRGERVIGRREHHIHSGDSSRGAHTVVIKRTQTHSLVEV